MSYIFRDFNKPHACWGDILVYDITDYTLSIMIFGLHNMGCECPEGVDHEDDCIARGPNGHLLMSVKYSPNADLYNIINIVLDAITKNYAANTLNSYIDSIIPEIDVPNSVWEYTKYKGCSLPFNRENMKHLTKWASVIPLEFYPFVAFGEISEDGVFKHKGEVIEFADLVNKRDKADIFLHRPQP